jgi:hypothetical protein
MTAHTYVAQSQHKLSEQLERIIDTVSAPRKAFEGIDSAPSAWLPVSLLVAIRLAIIFTYFSPSVQPAKLIVTFILAAIPVLLQLTLVVGCIWFVVMAFGGETELRKVTSLTANALAVGETVRFAWAAIENLLGVAGSGATGPVFSNLGFLVPESEFATRQLLSAVDVITLYVVITIGFGLVVIARKVSGSKAMIAAAAPWLIYTGVGFGLKLLLTR